MLNKGTEDCCDLNNDSMMTEAFYNEGTTSQLCVPGCQAPATKWARTALF
jgi:hypothetical protein